MAPLLAIGEEHGIIGDPDIHADLSLKADSSALVTVKIRLQIELRNGVIAIPSAHLAPGLITVRSFCVLLNILSADFLRSLKLESVWQGACFNILVKPDQRGNKDESAD